MAPEGGLSLAGIAMLVALFLLWRVAYAHYRQLVPDEAVYWAWSRHMAGGYLDHPPMIAWMIHFSRKLFGSTEFGVRCPAILCATGTLIIILGIARLLRFQRRMYGWLLALWLTSPLLAALGTLMTPDTPSIFFSAAAMALVVWIAQRSTPTPSALGAAPVSAAGGQLAPDRFRPLLWLGFGICCGLAFLSKYTTILLPAAVFLALIGSRLGRRHLMQPWIYLSAIPAVAIFWPVIAWNRAHQWISFRYQLNHGLDTDRPTLLKGLGEFIGGQALIWTPVLFVAAIIVLIYFWKRALAREPTASPDEQQGATGQLPGISLAQRVLLLNATLPLVFFAYAATRAHGEVNWPAFAYFPLSLLIVHWIAQPKSPPAHVGSADEAEVLPTSQPPSVPENRSRGDVTAASKMPSPRPPKPWPESLVRLGCVVAAVGLVIMQVPELDYRITPAKWRSKWPSKLNETFGWKELAQQLYAQSDRAIIVCNRHQNAGELSFYIPGQPDIWAVSEGSRPTAWDYFDYQPPFADLPRVVFIGSHNVAFAKKYGFDENPVNEFSSTIVLPDGRLRKARGVTLVHPYVPDVEPLLDSFVPLKEMTR